MVHDSLRRVELYWVVVVWKINSPTRLLFTDRINPPSCDRGRCASISAIHVRRDRVIRRALDAMCSDDVPHCPRVEVDRYASVAVATTPRCFGHSRRSDWVLLLITSTGWLDWSRSTLLDVVQRYRRSIILTITSKPSAVLGKLLFTCIFDTDTDTWSQMYLRYRYKILCFKCIKDTDTTKKYLDTRYIDDGCSLIGMFKCYFFNKMLPFSAAVLKNFKFVWLDIQTNK